ncbi:hypothetical protein FE634_18935 [Nocardioides dongxiaopingii]|uniref:hypothetical protein n=1 Tax=Nocardioides sp. S-1144 TaxID=2582905 RepID=UPI00110E41E5|nr:hypothetical protein [Nocardioides sp. S-1144]QCW51959.1 hypothetical protein FE634_18935 [Nocardioides sp. S-1144]
MSTPGRLAVFALGLVVVFAAAVGIGRATGPVGPVGPADGREVAHAGDVHSGDGGDDDGGGHGTDAEEPGLPGGLATSQDGYTLELDRTTLRPGTREVAFRITDEHGDAVTDYRVEHERRLHLVAVRRDGTGFQHVHPELGADGTWRVPLDLTPSAWRLIADFAPADTADTGQDDAGLVLGADLLVPGPSDVAPAPPVTRTATVDDYTVTLTGDLVAGDHSTLELTVSRDGVPVTDLQPYLGAFGHLVALREGDLAHLHVHPEEGASGPTVAFTAEVPSAGRYRLHLDFRHDDVVRTASFLLEADHDDH